MIGVSASACSTSDLAKRGRHTWCSGEAPTTSGVLLRRPTEATESRIRGVKVADSRLSCRGLAEVVLGVVRANHAPRDPPVAPHSEAGLAAQQSVRMLRPHLAPPDFAAWAAEGAPEARTWTLALAAFHVEAWARLGIDPAQLTPQMSPATAALVRGALSGGAPDKRVFTTAHGTPLEPRNINHEWAKVCASAGIAPIRPHDLGTAWRPSRQGVDLKTVQSMLRHSRLATRADMYTHVLRSVQRSGADRIGDLLTDHGVGPLAANPRRA